MRYQKIESQIWNDEKFIQLTPSQQRLFFYILTCPHGNLLGLFVLKKGYACEDLKSLSKDFDKDLSKLIETGLIKYDEKVQIVFINNFLKHNPITNPNQLKSSIKIIKELPKSKIIDEVKGLVKGLREGLREGLSKPEAEAGTGTGTGTGTGAEYNNIMVTPQAEMTQSQKPDYNNFEKSITAAWNSICDMAPMLSKIIKISTERRKHLKSRFTNTHFRDNILQAVGKITDCPFLLGQSKPKNEGEKPFIVSFDWLVKNGTNYLKILEGKYDVKKTAGEIFREKYGGQS